MTTTTTPEQADTLPAKAIDLDALEPCPFCGAQMELIESRGEHWYEHPGECEDCICAGMQVFDDAIAAWNRRAAVPSEQEPKPKVWLIEERLPSGSIRWHCVEHEHQAKEEALKLGASARPLYLHPAPAAGVKVKELEWSPSGRHTYKRFDGVEYSAGNKALNIYYHIDHYFYREGLPPFLLRETGIWFATLHEAKATAQANYEARILSALDTGEPK